MLHRIDTIVIHLHAAMDINKVNFSNCVDDSCCT